MKDEKAVQKERVSIFIDGNNFYYGCEDTIGTHHIDFKKFIKNLAGNRQLVDTFYYNTNLDKSKDKATSEKQERFYTSLTKIGIKVVLCNFRKSWKNGHWDYNVKGDDVNLAVDMITNAVDDNYDTAILVSGDGDFLPLVRVIKDKFGKKVENAIFKVNQSHDLRVLCQPNIIYMDNFISSCKRGVVTIPFFDKLFHP